ncbi:piggyBac transposable element-derived protein 4-like [Mizuhopecten yessoensis]|uniref:piggyBac transposable element-derived protein 4-like n=1 Tax=Mizuhopecten yessoensis TaxID=6573 RepID=UPI000B457370|nr:piggyBac transposable element-derived protein 4-like [Mizuhopecten yessoensis]XP_021370908.1 piggyBac transposable element-derived protein 4-like [Mizuhopecten yessoensis]XP_021377708.1 piggyBac transposable element-derived protein 4-like [Mizuhopecten yessoensis]
MAEAEFYELVGNSDSEDDEFMGFYPEDIGDEIGENFDLDADIDLDDQELREIEQEVENEMDREDRDPKHNAYFSPWLTEFSENSGPKHVEGSESDIFLTLFNNEIIDILVTQTNLYYEQYITNLGGVENLKPHARARKWTDVTNSEMKAFIGIILYMGVVRLPGYDSYWNTDELISLKGFTVLMPRDRFLNILSFFHAADNSQEPPRDSPNFDPTYKFSEVAKLLVSQWQHYYYPGRELSVDETLIPYKGRTKYLQYIPSKPHKWGLKTWTLAESSTGYVYNWVLYTGKAAGDPTKGAAHRVVMNVTEPLLHKGHHLYCDNFFTSPSLFQDLEDNQTGACGTLRTNRIGVPNAVKTAKPKKGDLPVVVRQGNKLYICWHDKRQVNMLTTVHNGSTYTKTVRSKFHDGHVREVDHPRAIQLYTQHMGGVDVADQQTQYCVSQHRMLKWWKKLVICNLLEVTFCNSKIIWKSLNGGKKVSSMKFRLAVIHGLLEGYEPTNKRFARPVNNPPSRLTEKHFPSMNPHMTAGGRRSTPDCAVCSDREQKKRHQTQFICLQCDTPLCVYPCFMRYHSMVYFKITCSPELHK